ncbi:uncharacterized protein Z520_11653 [Fonsecaea multimorphosa CBS 102226]|uniref:Hemerythrin-like domain-containing protein n=1 Tax=Fonsecaea multimorphosa CBS 102226 TaxID=1442371 RepID=A0A0D2JQ41_9EURO|nr:uncharacterized protein Z520_11653 [Fonsecaea multimorphosa CBS 102226]KIX92624.1 hypothetical protein Z520_11653 [Fonsecaea multimorphosa CBS 102226]OAL17847.1 hypothetical protein AYO22_11191 [Fonsecaea multimorphosa]
MAAPTSTSYGSHSSSDSSHHNGVGSPNLPYDPPLTFSTVIDHDHNTINKYAGRLLRAKAPQDRARLLREVTWRLVRHDVSEDIVMRPAFIEHLGDEGVHMAEHDRTDHERARTELLALFHIPLEGDEFLGSLRALFAELLEHMRIESGQQIPHLEHMLDPEESQRLGREYLKTQRLTPDLEIVVDKSTGARRRVWRDVEEFARTDLQRFKEIWEELKLSEEPVDTEEAEAFHKKLDRGKL